MAISCALAARFGAFATQEDALVEVGSLSGAHGLEGAVRVRSRTALPHVRLATSGWRWIRTPGQATTKKVWLESGVELSKDVFAVKMRELATREDAEALVGAVLLAKADERPPLEDEEEVYQDQLIGVNVYKRIHSAHDTFLVDPNASETSLDGQETETPNESTVQEERVVNGQCKEEEPHPSTHRHVGKVTGFVDGTGTYDTVTVELAQPFVEYVCQASNAELPEGRATAFIPFAREIVVAVDIEKKYMVVNPPDGLLEMGLVGVNAKKKKTPKRRWRRKKGPVQGEAKAVEKNGEEQAMA